ncbi:MAG: type II/IV secretion system protein [Candidatus Roizmanbacteria bacterium]|nr:MAG: type II/IV secretion system protein [Candidatus Roizmanbacteria bacterium]
MMISPKTFLSELVKGGILDQSSADRYEIDSIQKNLPIDNYLLQQTEIKKEDILKVKAHFLNVPYIDISTAAVDPQALGLISESIARKDNILPYLYDSKKETIYIATEDPLNLSLADFLERKTGKKVMLALGFLDDIGKTIGISYTQGLSPEVKEALQEVSTQSTPLERQGDSSTSVHEPPIAKIVNTILEFAVKSRASDIHIEPQEIKSRVRYRIDGILQEKLSLPRGLHDSLISRIKILSEMKIDEKRIPQDGRFNFKLGNEEVDLRVSSLPTVNGEKIVMRLLKKTGGLPSLTELGLRGIQFKDLEESFNKPYGIILITGPTGSGKTTTLYSILTRLNKPGVNIVTLEDPVEYQIPGINQVQINPQAGLTFANGLRSFLRQDPNIILVGEIRDKETTQLAIQAALTGHLVFSTLHTNDSATAIPRLIDLGGEPFLIASVINASVAQRIARKVCTYCKELYEPDPKIQTQIKEGLGELLPKIYKEGQPMKIARGKGCNECGNSGYLGRIAIFEVLKITPVINKMILQESSAKEIETQARKEGLIIMLQDGYLKVLEGITTIEEVLRVANV